MAFIVKRGNRINLKTKSFNAGDEVSESTVKKHELYHAVHFHPTREEEAKPSKGDGGEAGELGADSSEDADESDSSAPE